MRFRVAASVLLFAAFAASVCSAQINGVPPSVTSFGFGGSRSMAPGIPASVTSLGPRGFQCCINPMFPVTSNPNLVTGNFGFRPRHPGVFPVFVPLYTPNYTPGYTPVIVVQTGDQAGEDEADDYDYASGPTTFEHRRPRRHSAEAAYGRGYEEGRAAAEDALDAREERAAQRAADPNPETTKKTAAATKDRDNKEQPAPAIEPKTVLVYKDGHKEEVTNYAIVGDELFDFTVAGRRKIAVAVLDVAATTKANDERGMDFQLPVAHPGN
jgi:hypothetical protein